MCVSELETRDIEVEFTEYLLDYEMSSSCCCPMYETLESLFLCDFASILVLLHIIRLLVVAHTHTHIIKTSCMLCTLLRAKKVLVYFMQIR